MSRSMSSRDAGSITATTSSFSILGISALGDRDSDDAVESTNALLNRILLTYVELDLATEIGASISQEDINSKFASDNMNGSEVLDKLARPGSTSPGSFTTVQQLIFTSLESGFR